MDRVAAKTVIALTAILLLLPWGAPAVAGNPGPAEAGTASGSRDRKPGYRLDEIRIVGSSDRPAVLFILPRSRFVLFPPRNPDLDVKNRLLMDDKGFWTSD